VLKGACIALCISLSACATVEVKRTTDATYKDGLRFYRSVPYLLVTEDKDKVPQMTIIALPNMSEEYVVRTKTGLGTTEMSATLEGGWNLTQLGAKVDSKIPETITAVGGFVPAVGGPFLRSLPSSGIALHPGLYRIEFDRTTGAVSGLKEVPLKPSTP